MIFVNDQGTVFTEGKPADLLSELGVATTHVMKSCELSDEEKFIVLAPLIFGLDRLNKIQSDSKLHSHVDLMLDEIWKSMELFEKYVDSYKVSSKEDT